MRPCNLRALVIMMTLMVSSGAFASRECHVPLAQWQPRAALAAKLMAEGWVIEKIKTDDGCYKAYGRRADGVRVKAKYTPDTLTRIVEKMRRKQQKRGFGEPRLQHTGSQASD